MKHPEMPLSDERTPPVVEPPEPVAWTWEQFSMPYPEATEDEWHQEFSNRKPDGAFYRIRNLSPLYARPVVDPTKWVAKEEYDALLHSFEALVKVSREA
jgi:hypothetical protein